MISRASLFPRLALLLITGVLVSTLVKNPVSRVDLKICLDAAQHLLHSQTVYDISVPLEHTKPPLGTLLFIPLSLLPFTLMSWLWNVFIIGSALLSAWLLARDLNKKDARSIALYGLLFCLAQLNVELNVGQYNVIALLLIVIARQTPSLVTGMIGVILLLLKPTNILFIPWIVKNKKSPSLHSMIAGGGLALVGLTTTYLILFGWDHFIQSHIQWLHFLPISTAKHIANPDNLGIPGVLSFLGSQSWFNNGLLLLGLGLTIAICATVTHSVLQLGLCGLLYLWISPMTWPQNFCLVLPAILWALQETRESRPHKRWIIASLSVFYLGSQILNYTFLGKETFLILREFRPLFWTSVVAAGLGVNYWQISYGYKASTKRPNTQ